MVCLDSATASDLFDHFCLAQSFRSILALHRRICLVLNIKPCKFPQYYPKLKSGLKSWKAKQVFVKFDKRAAHKCYARASICAQSKVLVIGCGPCGLRAAIEAQLLGARVVVVEKRDRFSRNNVLHLWPMVIHDLKSLGAKHFFGKFCAGSIDHISIRQMQCILLKVALLLGVEVFESVGFEELVEPSASHTGWRARFEPADHCVSQYQFDVLVGADGKRNTFKCFKRKEFRGKLAIAVTANFVNRCTEAEACVDEISGVAFVFNQKFFKDMYHETGIDLENIVYYKDDTHYFVMTAKKQSLLKKGVIKEDFVDTRRLLSSDNVCREKLMQFAREAANFATHYRLPTLVYALNHYGREDVAMFDFTCMYASANASCVLERRGSRLLLQLVGDSLLEPFWPTGSGCARGFLSCLDAGWQLRSWSNPSISILDCLAERESIYRLLGQTTASNINPNFSRYTLDPRTRYPNLNRKAVLAPQVLGLVDTDCPSGLVALVSLGETAVEKSLARGGRRCSESVQQQVLLWCRRVAQSKGVDVLDFDQSFQSGEVLCAILSHYRPALTQLTQSGCSASGNNSAALTVARVEFGLTPSSSLEQQLLSGLLPDKEQMAHFMEKVYIALEGEIPYQPAEVTDLPSFSPTSVVVSTDSHEGRSRRRRSDRVIKTPENLIGEAKQSVTDQKDPEKQKAFASKVRDIENQFSSQHSASATKPKDLLRAIGKLEQTDWNLRQIENKILEQQKPSKTVDSSLRRPALWNKERFEDTLHAVSQQASAASSVSGSSFHSRVRYEAIDQQLRRLESKLRDGNTRDVGERGANRVSQMARRFLASELHVAGVSTVDGAAAGRVCQNNVTEQPVRDVSSCHFCSSSLEDEEVESAEGLSFHRACFRCQFCGTALKQMSYAFDGELSRFFCLPHYGLHALARYKYQRKEMVSGQADNEANETTERAEFENSSCMELSSDDEDKTEMDENEWTDHNFGTSFNLTTGGGCALSADSEDDTSAASHSPISDRSDSELEASSADEPWPHRHFSHSASRDPSDFYESDGVEQDFSGPVSHLESDVQKRNRRLLEVRLAESVLKSQRGTEAGDPSDSESWCSCSTERSSDQSTEVASQPEFEPVSSSHRTLPTIVVDHCACRLSPEGCSTVCGRPVPLGSDSTHSTADTPGEHVQVRLPGDGAKGSSSLPHLEVFAATDSVTPLRNKPPIMAREEVAAHVVSVSSAAVSSGSSRNKDRLLRSSSRNSRHKLPKQSSSSVAKSVPSSAVEVSVEKKHTVVDKNSDFSLHASSVVFSSDNTRNRVTVGGNDEAPPVVKQSQCPTGSSRSRPNFIAGLQRCRTDTQVNVRLGATVLSDVGSAWRNSLALKKKYLTGVPADGAAVRPSVSTDLTSRVNTFMSRISETQKLLNPSSQESSRRLAATTALNGLSTLSGSNCLSRQSEASAPHQLIGSLTGGRQVNLPVSRRLLRSATDLSFASHVSSTSPMSRALLVSSERASQSRIGLVLGANCQTVVGGDAASKCGRQREQEATKKPRQDIKSDTMSTGSGCSTVCRSPQVSHLELRQNNDEVKGKVQLSREADTNICEVSFKGGSSSVEKRCCEVAPKCSNDKIAKPIRHGGCQLSKDNSHDGQKCEGVKNLNDQGIEDEMLDGRNNCSTIYTKKFEENTGKNNEIIGKVSFPNVCSSGGSLKEVALTSACSVSGFGATDNSRKQKTHASCSFDLYPSVVEMESHKNIALALSLVESPAGVRSADGVRLNAVAASSSSTLSATAGASAGDVQQESDTIERLERVLAVVQRPAQSAVASNTAPLSCGPALSATHSDLAQQTGSSLSETVSSRARVAGPLSSPAASDPTKGFYPLRRCHTDLGSPPCQGSVVRDLVLARVQQRAPRRRVPLDRNRTLSRLFRPPTPPTTLSSQCAASSLPSRDDV